MTLKIFDEPRTGGELYYKYLKGYLESRNDVEIMMPNERDKEIINSSHSTLLKNLLFFWYFVRMIKGSVIIQESTFSHAYFLANCFVRIFHKRVHIIVIVHETTWQQYHGLQKIKNKIKTFLFYRSADCIIVNSKFIAKEITSSGAQSKKIRVRHLPGQQFKIRNIYRNKKNNKIKILCVANIRPKKGQKYLIEALKYLKGYEFMVTLAGMCKDEDYERILRSLIRTYGLEEKVRIVGWLDKDRMSAVYQESDIFVLPSLYEPLGLVIQEAMQFGIPIVASDAGGIPEQVANMRDALLVPPGNAETLANAIKLITNNPDLRKKLVNNGYQRLKDGPKWDEVLKHDMSLITSSHN